MPRRQIPAALFLALLILLLFLFVASATGMIIQISRTSRPTGLKNNWNALIVGLSYIALAAITLVYFVTRSVSTRRAISRISILHPTKHSSFPPAVQRHIEREFDRACLIAHRSLPRVESREGWGRPGTNLEGIRFRSALLDTILPIDALARQVLPHLPPFRPHQSLMKQFSPLIPLLPQDDGTTCLHTYVNEVERFRFNSLDPTEEEFLAGMQAAGQLSRILDEYKLELLAQNTNSSVASLEPIAT